MLLTKTEEAIAAYRDLTTQMVDLLFLILPTVTIARDLQQYPEVIYPEDPEAVFRIYRFNLLSNIEGMYDGYVLLCRDATAVIQVTTASTLFCDYAGVAEEELIDFAASPFAFVAEAGDQQKEVFKASKKFDPFSKALLKMRAYYRWVYKELEKKA